MVSSVSDLIKYHSNLSCVILLFTFFRRFTFCDWLAPLLFTRVHSKICLILVLQVIFLILGLSLCNVMFFCCFWISSSNSFSSKIKDQIQSMFVEIFLLSEILFPCRLHCQWQHSLGFLYRFFVMFVFFTTILRFFLLIFYVNFFINN